MLQLSLSKSARNKPAWASWESLGSKIGRLTTRTSRSRLKGDESSDSKALSLDHKKGSYRNLGESKDQLYEIETTPRGAFARTFIGTVQRKAVDDDHIPSSNLG